METMMHHPSLQGLAAALQRVPKTGPVALVLCDDAVEMNSTLDHHAQLGFPDIVIVGDPQRTLATGEERRLHHIDYDLGADGALPQLINTLIAALPGRWLYYCYNAEYLYYPFCEDRSVTEMLTFMQEERRATVFSTVVDLYAADLGQHQNGVDRTTAQFDRSGYYALPRTGADDAALDRQVNIQGGLRWRFEEHIPPARQRSDRVSLFRAQPGLQMLPDRTFNMAEYNTYACPWHHNLTAVVASFRTAKALCRNPGSREHITTFQWPQSTRFTWGSQQLVDLGLMEPGQWF